MPSTIIKDRSSLSHQKKKSPITSFFKYVNGSHYREKGKRLWDLCSSIPCFILALPLFALVALAIKLDSEGPVFYKQKRLGKNGKVIDCLKFRTMFVNADQLSCTTSDKDNRITRVGRFIRPLSIDELLQLVNIIKGEMSFIGPRPISVSEFETVKKSGLFTESFVQELIPSVNPGILGWAIFHGREKISYEDRVRLNNEYEERLSLLFDSYISFLTLKKYWVSYFIVFTCLTVLPTLLLFSLT